MQQPWRYGPIALIAAILLVGCHPLSSRIRPEQCDGQPPQQECPEEALLTPDDVIRLTMQNVSLGSALTAGSQDQERHPCHFCLPRSRRQSLLQTLQSHAADEARNQAAGLVVQAYYRLAEARGQHLWACRTLDAVGQLAEQAEELENQGLAVPEALTDSKRARVEVEMEALRLKMLGDRLHEQIRQAIGGCPCKILTLEVFHVMEIPLDEKAAVQIGLQSRPDLKLLRAALSGLNSGTVSVVRQMLAGLNSLLGGPSLRCLPMADCLIQLIPCLMEDQVDLVRRQLRVLLREREQQAAGNIRQAICNLRSQTKLVQLAQKREELAHKKLLEAQEKTEKGLADSTALPLARRDYFKARAESLHEAIEWEIARANLEHSQGLLFRRGSSDQSSCPQALLAP